jgi:hypothetical protein
MSRRTPEIASVVCMLARTLRPVTAVRSTIRGAVARSRISPACTTSGLRSRSCWRVSANDLPAAESNRICVTPGTTSSGLPSSEIAFRVFRKSNAA